MRPQQQESDYLMNSKTKTERVVSVIVPRFNTLFLLINSSMTFVGTCLAYPFYCIKKKCSKDYPEQGIFLDTISTHRCFKMFF